ncbi:carboxypeptidase N subunit 2-like [Littorina saxatilis]|uniref:Uncharacterized protein n=1 Tax=Littorina saxatilis TaxID=31220 RepID=A0AAN9BKJ3_9CAEN
MALSTSMTFNLALLNFALLVTLTMTLKSIAMTQQQDSICIKAPGLQILDRSITEYSCETDENIHALNCSGKGIPSLPSTKDTPVGIQVLDFSHNMIKCLPKINNTVSSCNDKNCPAGCLRELRLHHNEIDFLHKDVFNSLSCLNVIDLSNNLITNVTLSRQHFAGLAHLNYLDLHGNPLRSLPDNLLVFPYMPHLHTLNLSSCQLEWVGEASLDDFPEMQVLDLSRNKLRKLASRSFQGLKALTVLDLRWNSLEVIAEDTFADLRELQELWLEHNNLHYIFDTAFHLQTPLSFLGLSENQFSDIPVGALATLKKLQTLDMSHNPFLALRDTGYVNTTVRDLRLDFLPYLHKVKDGAFSGYPRLSRLSMTHARRLATIPERAFRGSEKNLIEVFLDHNGLTYLSEELLPLKQLQMLTLHGNRWHCDCKLSWTAGHPLGNTSIRCEDPLKLHGQELETLQPDELSCPKDLVRAKVIIALCFIGVAMVILVLFVWNRRRSMPCQIIRGTKGRYITVYTKNVKDNEEEDDGSCANGQVDDLDLDLGSGAEGSRSEGGKVMIMLTSFRNGYKRLTTKETESTQDLTSASDV